MIVLKRGREPLGCARVNSPTSTAIGQPRKRASESASYVITRPTVRMRPIEPWSSRLSASRTVGWTEISGQLTQVEHDGAGPVVFKLPRQIAEFVGRARGDLADPQIADRVRAVESDVPTPGCPLAETLHGRRAEAEARVILSVRDSFALGCRTVIVTSVPRSPRNRLTTAASFMPLVSIPSTFSMRSPLGPRAVGGASLEDLGNPGEFLLVVHGQSNLDAHVAIAFHLLYHLALLGRCQVSTSRDAA